MRTGLGVMQTQAENGPPPRWPLRTYLFRGETWLALVIGAGFASLNLLVFNDGDSNTPSGIAFSPGTGQATSPAPGAENASDGAG